MNFIQFALPFAVRKSISSLRLQFTGLMQTIMETIPIDSAFDSHEVANYFSPGQVTASSTSVDAARGYSIARSIGRARRSDHIRRSAEAETSRAHFGLGQPGCNFTSPGSADDF